MGPSFPRGHGTLSFPSSTLQNPAVEELGKVFKLEDRLSTERRKEKQQQLKMEQQENMAIRNLESIRPH